jgi:hypothetical protein
MQPKYECTNSNKQISYNYSILIMSCVPAQITSTREQEYFVHQRSSAIKEIMQNDPRKGSLRALRTESNKYLEIPYQLQAATLPLQEIIRRYRFLTLLPPSPECSTRKRKTSNRKFNSPPPASSTESLTQKTSSKENRQGKEKLKVTRNRAPDTSSSSRRNKAFLRRQLFPFRMWIIMRVFYE